MTDERSGKNLLEDDKLRFEIELESFGQAAINGLWNSPNTRNIFKEIVACEFLNFSVRYALIVMTLSF